MKTARRISSLLFVILLSGTSMAADEPEASQPPRTSGPLVGDSVPCDDNGPPGRNEINTQVCSWTYHFLPAHTDTGNDFSVYWIQFEMDPGRGWCAKEMSFHLEVPSDIAIVSATPDKNSRLARRSAGTTTLVVDGGGAAPVPGGVEQDVVLGKGKIRVKLGEHSYSFRWTGNSPKKVMAAVGLQLATPRIPAGIASVWSEGGAFAFGNCRPQIIRSGR